MPSQLVGLMYRMTWNDFPHPMPPPPPGQKAKDAEFKPLVSFTQWLAQPVPGSRPERFVFPDNLTVRVFFDRANGRVSARAKTAPQAEKDRLLKHEQGHYDIAGLIGRDFFLEAMQLKGFEYESKEDAEGEFATLRSDILDKLNALQKRYDDDTEDSTNTVVQNRWNALIGTAFTSLRSPPAAAANGVPLKARLLDVLQAAGIRS